LLYYFNVILFQFLYYFVVNHVSATYRELAKSYLYHPHEFEWDRPNEEIFKCN